MRFDAVEANTGVLALADSLYRFNHHQAISFEINAISKLATFIPELFPGVPNHEIDKIKQVINVWTLAKFCHYAETVAAYSLSFLVSYDDQKDEINGIFKYIIKYSMGQIVDFFTYINKRDEAYISQILGYPAPRLQNSDTANIFRKSCNTVKDILDKVAGIYLELYDFYAAYKHGYRIVPGKGNATIDIITYIDNDGNQMYFETTEKEVKEIRVLSNECSMILDSIFENHYERIKRETIQGKSTVRLKTVIKKEATRREEWFSILYPTRGESKKEEELSGDEIYAKLFSDDTEKENKGKIVAIDIDESKIISMDYDHKLVIEAVHNRQSSGRVRLRRVGKEKGLGIKFW